MPKWNGPVLTQAQIIKFVMSYDSKAELCALFFTAQEMLLMRTTFEEMRWSQPNSPTQTDKSAAAVVVNDNPPHPENLRRWTAASTV